MLYNAIAQPSVVSIINPAGGPNVNFPSIAAWPHSYSLGYGVVQNPQGGSGAGQNVPANGSVYIPNLITCAAAVYVYTNPAGAVLNVAVFHAHTGMIPIGHLPTAGVYNINAVPAAQIHVVFASSQSMNANPHSGIQTAADGLIAITNAGVPAGNIRVVTGTPVYGANDRGEVGLQCERSWANGNLQTTLANVTALALNDYTAQFPVGETKIGLFGSTHNLTKGQHRIQNLNIALNAATRDDMRLQALRGMLTGPGSYKAGSLKLFMVQRFYNLIRGLPMGNITPVNAQQEGIGTIAGITNGIF